MAESDSAPSSKPDANLIPAASEAATGGQPPQKMRFFDLLMAFLMPTLIGKTLLLYFGLKYSEYPGQGYGTGLVLSVCFTLFMLGRFLWKYRDYDDT